MSKMGLGAIATLGIFFLGLSFSAQAQEQGQENQPKQEGTVSAVGPFLSTGEVSDTAPGERTIVGTFEGVMYIDSGEGLLDMAGFACPATVELDTSSGMLTSNGKCTLTGVQGNSVYAEWSCKGRVGNCQGDFKLTGGTGPFEGITGSGPIKVRTAMVELAADVESGEVVSGAIGVIIWPELKYKLAP